MSFPLQITFRDFEATPSLEQAIRRWASRLERTDAQIERGQVVIAQPHQHHRQGRHFHVRIALTVPGGEVVVSRECDEDAAHEDAYVAIRDAFRAARRQLQAA